MRARTYTAHSIVNFYYLTINGHRIKLTLKPMETVVTNCSGSSESEWYPITVALVFSLLETFLLLWAYQRHTLAFHRHGSVGFRVSNYAVSGSNSYKKPESVNYHFTRQCNYQCGFCFHTAKTSFVLPIDEAKRGLQLLREAGMEKINFSGGEPFIHQKGKFVGELVRYCKEDLHLPSVTIVSNGSLITEEWFQDYGKHLDILAISCDSFDEGTNIEIGRRQGNKNHLSGLCRIREWCRNYQVAFKINTVVNTHNLEEDMSQEIIELNPVRWKVFQCLLIEGENVGPEARRNATTFVITDEQFKNFIQRHQFVPQLVPESNTMMRDSYLILDEYMRFLDCTKGRKDPSKSILDVGVDEAMKFSGFDEAMFLKRGGRYVWSKGDMKLDW